MPSESKETDEQALVTIIPSPSLDSQETENLLQRVLPGLSSFFGLFRSSFDAFHILIPPSTASACNLTAQACSVPPLTTDLDCSSGSPGRPPTYLFDWCWRRVTCSAQQRCAVASSAPQVFDARPLCMVVDAEPTRAGGAWARWRRLFSSSSRRMSSVPTDERTGTDLSRCLAGVTAPRARPGMGSMGNKDKPRTHSSATGSGSSGTGCVGGTAEMNGHGSRSRRMLVVQRPLTLAELWQDERFLKNFFFFFNVHDRRTLAQVCAKWRDVLYQPRFWLGLAPVLRCRELRGKPQLRKHLYGSMQRRGFDSVSLIGANDDDVYDMINSYPPCAKHVRRVALRCSAISDKGMEILLEHMQCVCQLELSGCNEITEAGLWTCLTPRLVALSIADCINVADESVGAVAQLLPSLYEFNLQAYHVTDAALGYFSAKQAASLSILRLQSCWEVTNHGLVNIVHALPNLTILSLSGCSKITDDGVELIAENLRHLRTLDLSWCPRITDAALEYIACDLTQLEELTLDRCVHITDIGIGYISTMLSLTSLFLRWCTQIRDFGLQHLCSMRNLQVLSLAGCSLLTSSGLSSLIQLRHLQELELTNCPGASRELFDYLHEHLPKCLIIE